MFGKRNPPNGPAPTRILPEDVQAAIADEFYFSAADGVIGESRIRAMACDIPTPLDHLTFCVLVLRNGATVVGVNYGPVTSENFDAKIARTVARASAVQEAWMLLGFALKDRRYHELE